MQNKKIQRILGITGGVGAGKSLVMKILEVRFEALPISTDQVAKELLMAGQPGYQALADQLGEQILEPDGQIDRPKLARLMFRDKAVLALVNKLIHPLVWEAVSARIGQSDRPLIAVESALFLEKAHDICDELWYVYTPREQRIGRLVKSRGYSVKQAEDMIQNQPSEQQFLAQADVVLRNNGTEQQLYQQIEQHLTALK